jgi:hypothetical protein
MCKLRQSRIYSKDERFFLGKKEFPERKRKLRQLTDKKGER